MPKPHGKNNDPNMHITDDSRGKSTAFPDTSAGDEPPLTWAARTMGVPEFAVGAMNKVVNAAVSALPGFANGGYVGDGYAPPTTTHHTPTGGLGRATRPRMPHESAPGIPCASCAAGYTRPIR